MDPFPITLNDSQALPIAGDELSLTNGQDGGLQDTGAVGAGKKKPVQQPAGAKPGDPRFFAPPSAGTSGGTTSPNNAGQNPLASRLSASLFFAVRQDPDQYAKRLQIQAKTGIPPAVSAGHEIQIQQHLDATSIDPLFFAQTYPRTTGWGSNLHNAAATGVADLIRIAGMEQNGAAMDAVTQEQSGNPQPTESLLQRMSDWWHQADFKGLGRDLHTFFGGMPWSPMEGMMTPTGEDLTTAYDQGHAQRERGILSMKAHVYHDATTDDLARLNELDEQLAQSKEPQTLGGQWFGGLSEMAGSQLPMMPKSFKAGAAAAIPAAGLGALFDGVGALEGAKEGFRLGFQGAWTQQNYEMIKGNTLEDMLQRGVDPDRAETAATTVAVFNSLLQLGLARVAGKPLGNVVTSTFDRALGNEIADGITQPTTAAAVKSALWTWTKHTAAGTADMGLQTIVDRAGQDYVDRKGLGGTVQDIFSADFGHQLGKTLVNATRTMGTINAVTGAMGLPVDVFRESNVGQTSPFFENFSQALKTQAEMDLPENAPEIHNDAMQTVLSGHLRMSRQAFNDYWSGQSMDPAVEAAKLGVTFSVDAATGREYAEVPTANYFGKLAAKDREGLALYVIDPASKLTLCKYQALRQWAASGGPAKLQAQLARNNPETAATPTTGTPAANTPAATTPATAIPAATTSTTAAPATGAPAATTPATAAPATGTPAATTPVASTPASSMPAIGSANASSVPAITAGGAKQIPIGPVVLNVDKQIPHSPANSLKQNRGPATNKSLLTADPYEMLKYAGAGQQMGTTPRGVSGFKERVDVGKVIGNHYNEKTGIWMPSTKIVIVYDKNNTVHIYPAQP